MREHVRGGQHVIDRAVTLPRACMCRIGRLAGAGQLVRHGVVDVSCGVESVDHPCEVRLVLAVTLLGGAVVAAAAPAVKPAVAAPTAKANGPAIAARPAKATPLPVWIGVFNPGLPSHPPWDSAKLTPVAHGGAVRVLTPETGAAASGDVVIVHPLLGKTAAGKIDKGAVALADFAFDQRDGDDGVVVLPGGTPVAFVAPSKADVAAIKATLVKTEALAGVRRALDRLELGAVDVDGDGKADVVVTYGCAVWFDGSCQSRGQFVLARRGGRWMIIE